MKTLVEYFQQGKQELEEKLKTVTTVEKVVEIVQIEISKLADISGEYINGLTPLQGRVAIGQLTVLSLSLEQLIVLREQNKVSSSKAEETGVLPFIAQEKKERIETSLISTIGSAALMAGTAIFVSGVANAAIPFLVTSAALGGIAPNLLEVFKSNEKTKSSEETINSQIEKPISELIDIDIERLLSELEQQLKRIDRDVSKFTEPEPPPKPTIENHSDVLEFLQNLMGDADYEKNLLPDYTRKRIEQLPTILRRYQIQAKFFELSQEQKQPTEEQEEMFEFEPSLNPDSKDYVTLVPALVKDNKIIKQGRVIQPASTVDDNETEIESEELVSETSGDRPSSPQAQTTELESQIVGDNQTQVDQVKPEELVAQTSGDSSSSPQLQTTELESQIVGDNQTQVDQVKPEELVAQTSGDSSSSPQAQATELESQIVVDNQTQVDQVEPDELVLETSADSSSPTQLQPNSSDENQTELPQE
ncbi:MAG: hypothetical protein F6K23_37505 [Okeania sp. SIO2C9]|uniref:hypothetical protein n=1 Tax=Okeania sp. SIO2C9 TaxID=2607791 RepID=UPI0013BF6A20|nr:hypothetical protein [Okeania sp. SIO2C9]NEQ78193.1 hypothetical protein [Okeania sp. SIO2C9]